MTFVGNAAFPRLAYRLRWHTRLGPGGLLAYVAFNTAVVFALRTWVAGFFGRIAEERKRAKEQVRERSTANQPSARCSSTSECRTSSTDFSTKTPSGARDSPVRLWPQVACVDGGDALDYTTG